MDSRAKAFWLGLFIIGALIIIGWFVLFLRPSFGDGRTTIKVLFSNIDKISIGSRVALAGRPVGEVVKIKLNPKAREETADALGNLYFYELTLKVDSSVHVYTYDTIGYSTSGLLGEKTIEITPKAAPDNSPSPKEITHDLLHGQSSDRLEQTIGKVMDVADTFQDTLQIVSGASEEMKIFVSNLNSSEVAQKTSLAFTRLHEAMEKADTFFYDLGDSGTKFKRITEQIASGQGTFGGLVYNDCFYLKMNEVMSKLEVTLSDINRYGILFQFNGKWQKEKALRERNLCRLYVPCNFFRDEMNAIANSLNRISDRLYKNQCCGALDCEPFSEKFHELLNQMNKLEEELCKDPCGL